MGLATFFPSLLTTTKGFDLVSLMIRYIVLIICCLITPHAIASAKIVVLGDSISAGFGIKQKESWASLLQLKLNKEKYAYQVINASISGDTSSGGLLRIDNILTRETPAIVIIELGGNDGLRGLKLKTVKQNLKDIIEKCHTHGAKTLLVGMQLPPNYGLAYTTQFSKIFTSLAHEKQIPVVPFIFEGIESNMKYFQQDGIHPTAEAQSILLNNIWPQLKPML